MDDKAAGTQKTSRSPWERMTITPVGHVGNVVQQGQGKIIGSVYDPGEVGYKPRGQDK
jgi:hypothetical protein